MARPAYLTESPVDFDDRADEVSIAAGATGTEILSFRVKPGFRALIVAIRPSWEAAGDRQITVRPLVNGNPLRIDAYRRIDVQIAAPEQDTYLPVPIPVEQNARIQILADNADGANAYFATCRVIVYYFPQRPA